MELNFNSTKITFPFIPYDLQKDYIQSIVNALDHGHNALL